MQKTVNQKPSYIMSLLGSVIEIDAALDIAADLEYLKTIQTDHLAKSMVNCFKILTGMIKPK